MQTSNPRLIFDIGVSQGNDLQYYLQKGFDVVGLEADPVMYDSLVRRFAREIAYGSVELMNWVAADSSGETVTFWRNQVYQQLSTLDRDHAQMAEHLVECQGRTANWRDVVGLRGVPYYCKIDIEGGESRFLRSMRGTDVLPPYISVECHSFEPIEVLFELGYRGFKFVNQMMLSTLVSTLPNPPLEGHYVPNPDWTDASGPFGRELPDRWVDFQEAAVVYHMIARLKTFRALLAPCWFDCHARLPE